MAWAWGLSRLIDALESAPGSRIDTKRLAVTGCSRYGGAVLVAGAFEPRIALTISQESGNGGANCWRLADAFFRTRGPGIPEQPAPWEIVVENTYFSPRFHGGVARNVNGLPYDHHLLLSLIEPRGLLLVQNSGIDWLMPSASYGCAVAARKVLQALGTSNFGFTQVGGHSHCQFPEKQAQDVEAFYDKFLRNKDADTGFFKSDLQPRDNRFVESQWINWTTPNLS
ncbi:hypothetical protein CC2G_002859 [Coprinopsis cinerea AmutBmut pab1-1]|nr:hypothetical protein CC2G_002859 [Coprinopsis cinerea AmutBmut pab1-1]